MARRRGRHRGRNRALRWVLAALASVVVVLAAVVLVGSLFGANQVKLPGQRQAVGATGRTIYLNNCAACHGPAGEGGAAFNAPGFTAGGSLHGLTFDERVAKISRGRPLRNMPAWRFQISAEDIRRVAAYTQVLSGQQPQPGVEAVR